ncbi:MAG: 3',5'-cyclic-nucleotide phosphodiesterase [Gemmataceae bacterium]|nr:3',5'-cyclic-nucleotide phosphodiesterase [Gemmataceae bacterium]
MKITLVPSPVGAAEEIPRQFLTSFLINDTIAIDAGSIGFYRSAHEQAHIKHVFLTHTHIDHIASLPIFVENSYEGRPDCVTIHGTAEVLQCLHTDMFNDRLWPDFLALSKPEAPFMRVATIVPGKTIEVDGIRLTPIPVNHVVPTVGYILEDGQSTVVIATDTAPTEEIWHRTNAMRNLKGVFLEATFPNELAWLADVSKHLTPDLLAKEIRKIEREVPIIVIHIKPRFSGKVVAEIENLKLPNVTIGKSGVPYTF